MPPVEAKKTGQGWRLQSLPRYASKWGWRLAWIPRFRGGRRPIALNISRRRRGKRQRLLKNPTYFELRGVFAEQNGYFYVDDNDEKS